MTWRAIAARPYPGMGGSVSTQVEARGEAGPVEVRSCRLTILPICPLRQEFCGARPALSSAAFSARRDPDASAARMAAMALATCARARCLLNICGWVSGVCVET